MTADSSGRVRVMVGNWSDGRPARGSWWGMKRMDGRCFCGVDPSVAWSLALSWSVDLVGFVVVGVGPALLRTDSWGAAVSARVLVMLSGWGDGGGESFAGLCRLWRGSVCRREGGEGRAELDWDWDWGGAVAANGDTGGVWVWVWV